MFEDFEMDNIFWVSVIFYIVMLFILWGWAFPFWGRSELNVGMPVKILITVITAPIVYYIMKVIGEK